MLKNNSNVEYSNILRVKNTEVEKKLMHATRYYNKGEYDVASSICKEALKLCNENSLDQAICYYRLAITNRGNKTTEDNYIYLNKSLLIFEDYHDQNSDLILQIQKTLAYQAKFALDMKDGDKLILATEKLLKSIEKQPNKEFEGECYRYFYHIALAQSDIDNAKYYIEKAKEIFINDDIEIKHEIKLKFIDVINDSKNDNKEIIRIKIIKDIFIPYYDQIYSKHADAFLRNKQPHLKILLKKDLIFILIIKLFIEEPSVAIMSAINLAKKLFNEYDVSEIRKSLNLKTHIFKENQKILLGFNLFPDKNPPFFTKGDVLYENTQLLTRNIFEEINKSSKNQLTSNAESYSLKPEWKR